MVSNDEGEKYIDSRLVNDKLIAKNGAAGVNVDDPGPESHTYKF